MIKYLVINGGGPTGIMSYGSLKYLFQHDFIQLKNIRAIYGTSIGAILGVIISLNYNWKTLDDYFLKRPWNKVFTLEPHDFFEMYSNKGLFQFDLVKELLTPLLTAKDLSENITLKEFYEFTNIDFHCYTSEMNSFEKVDLNYKTFPNIKLIKALEMTSAVPVLFKPVFNENKCYVDGGLFDNYPVNECLKNENCIIDEILGIKNKWINRDITITSDMNLFQYLQGSFSQIVKHIQKETSSKELKYEIKCLCDANMSDYTQWLEYITNKEKIAELMENGEQYGELFLNYEKEMNCENEYTDLENSKYNENVKNDESYEECENNEDSQNNKDSESESKCTLEREEESESYNDTIESNVDNYIDSSNNSVIHTYSNNIIMMK